MKAAAPERKVTFSDKVEYSDAPCMADEEQVPKPVKTAGQKLRRHSVAKRQRVRSWGECQSKIPFSSGTIRPVMPAEEGVKSVRDSWEAWKEAIYLHERS